MDSAEDLLFSTKRPQGFMTGTKSRKILMSLNECESKEQTPYVSLSVTNLR